MATVYLAEDLKHDRKVALKVLKPELAAVLGADRFVVEIKTTAALQHPHILPLLDSGEAAGLLYYVMPYVTGETLRARLESERQLPIDDALRISREVADALGAAHALGIIHRDIKPENILLQGGHALVADFGIALAVQSAAGARMTQTGLSLGTPQYMSPEQAMGEKTIDMRSDIYALGAVTYEMLIGEAPFTGPSVQAIVARVLSEEPRGLRVQRKSVPAGAERAILRALEKLPADRFATAAEFIVALGATTPPGEHAEALRSGPAGDGRRRVVLAAVLAAGMLATGWLLGRRTGASWEPPLGVLGRAAQVTWEPGLEITPALSPDGKLVAYVAGNGTQMKIFVRPVSGGRAIPLTDDTVAVEIAPQWSHDGSRILFISNNRVVSAAAGGGAPRPEVPPRAGASVIGWATWSPDDQHIAFTSADTLFVQDVGGATRQLVVTTQPDLCHWGTRDLLTCAAGNYLYLLPGLGFGNLAPGWIITVHAKTGAVHTVSDSLYINTTPRWSADGRSVLYASNRLGPSDIYSVRVTASGERDGVPRRVTTGLGVNSFSLSADGSQLAYAVMNASANIWSLPFPAGAGAAPTQHTFGQQIVENSAVSADGRWLYFDSNLGGNQDLYRMQLPSGVPERLTSESTAEFAPEPSPDGRWVAFHSIRGGSRDVFVMPLDGGALQQVTKTPMNEGLASWSPDGRALIFSNLVGDQKTFIATRNEQGAWTVRERLATGLFVRWAPDGEWFSFSTALTGGALGVAARDGGAPRILFDASRAGAPRASTSFWDAAGRTVYFKSHDATGAAAIWSVPFAGGVPQRVVTLGDARLRSDRYGFTIHGGRVYFALHDRQSNVWVMEIGSMR